MEGQGAIESPLGVSRAGRAWWDLRTGLSTWRIWWMLGIGDVRQRYRRSRLGQFWITLSMAVFVVGIGILYSQLLRVPVQEYIPFLATNIVVWGMISGIITDSTTMFTQAETYLRNDSLPKAIFAMRVLVRNVIVFAHNVVIIPLTFVILGVPISWPILLALVGLVIVAALGFVGSMLVGMLATRFRDLPQITTNVLQVAFFLTPITWPPSALGDAGNPFIYLNPFAIALHLIAEPLRGTVPSLFTYGSALLLFAGLLAITWPLFVRYRARIVYWL